MCDGRPRWPALKHAHPPRPLLPCCLQLPGYNCPPSCDKSSQCYCATFNTPGGLDPSTVPQFVVLVSSSTLHAARMLAPANVRPPPQQQPFWS